jgi:hypothetical protein
MWRASITVCEFHCESNQLGINGAGGCIQLGLKPSDESKILCTIQWPGRAENVKYNTYLIIVKCYFTSDEMITL